MDQKNTSSNGWFLPYSSLGGIRMDWDGLLWCAMSSAVCTQHTRGKAWKGKSQGMNDLCFSGSLRKEDSHWMDAWGKGMRPQEDEWSTQLEWNGQMVPSSQQTDGLCGCSLHDLSHHVRIYAHLNLSSRIYISSPMPCSLMLHFVRYPLVFHYRKWLLFNLVLLPVGAWLITAEEQRRAIWPRASISNGQRRRDILRRVGKWKKYNKWIMYIIVCPLANSWQFSCRSI